MKTQIFEVNFDGIVGNTHNYSGLSYGNIASTKNQFAISNPQAAALQGLEKMKLLADLGIVQAVLPPYIRPHIETLRLLGYSGKDSEILELVQKTAPEYLYQVSSAASMWAANAVTISDSASTMDHKVHLTPANLNAKFHRSIESNMTAHVLKEIFKDERFFVHHPCLPAGEFFSDEGAANHMHLCNDYGSQGLDIFVYGKSCFLHKAAPKRFPARQTLEAFEAISRRHKLDPSLVLFFQQNPIAIDAGAFHNDVVALSNKNVLLFHEDAFLNIDAANEIREKSKQIQDFEMIILEIKRNEFSIEDAISSYFFNSQLVSITKDKMLLIAPEECEQNPHIKRYINDLIISSTNPISGVQYLNLKQSMQNGGGPACLRFRAILNANELKNINQSVILTNELYVKLKTWIMKHYRDRLSLNDLADCNLIEETYCALSDLEQILNLNLLRT